MDRITRIILLLIIVLIMHLVEEVQNGFRQAFPLGEMPKPIFIGINIILYAFCFATLLLSIRSSSWAIPFTWILAIAMLMNGAGHIGVMSVRRSYFPGGITAAILLAVSIYLITQLMGE